LPAAIGVENHKRTLYQTYRPEHAAILVDHIERIKGMPGWGELLDLLRRARGFESIEGLILRWRGAPDLAKFAAYWGSAATSTFPKGLLTRCFQLLGNLQHDRISLESHMPAMRRVFEFLAEQRIVVSNDAIFESCAAAMLSVPEAISVVGVCIDPASPTAWVESCSTAFESHSRTGTVVVVSEADDSSLGLCGQSTFPLKRFKHRASVEFWGPCQLERYAATLAKSGIPLEIARFAILGSEYCDSNVGSMKNTVLLRSVGRMCLLADSSVSRQSEAGSSPKRQELLLNEIPRFASLSLANGQHSNARSLTGPDFIAEHERLLGQSLQAVVRLYQQESAVTFGYLCPHMVESLLIGKGRVIACLNGGLQAAGFREDREGTWPSPQPYGDNGTEHCYEYIDLAMAPTISHRMNSNPSVISLDNRGILPPFVPFGSVSTNVYEWVLATSFPHAYFAHLPRAIYRDSRPSDLTFGKKMIQDGQVSLSEFLLAIIEAKEVTDRIPPAEALACLGRYLIDTASLPPSDFAAYASSLLLERIDTEAKRIEQVTELRDKGSQTRILKLRNYVSARRAALCERKIAFYDDCGLRSEAPNNIKLVQQLLLNYGRLLCWWPEINLSARNLANLESSAD